MSQIENSKTKVKEFFDVKNDSNRKTEEDIISFLREYMKVIPEIRVKTLFLEEDCIDVLLIRPFYELLPYILNKDNSFQGKRVMRNVIYSRDGSINTAINENTSIKNIEMLFNRRFGNHLSPKDKFNKYIKDLNNWSASDESYQDFYYSKNSSFRIAINEREEGDIRKFNELEGYNELLRDTYLSEDIWARKRSRMNCAIEENFNWFKISVFEGKTKIYSFGIIEVYLKNYPTVGNVKILYIPEGLFISSLYDLDKDNIKESIKELPAYNICRLLHKSHNRRGYVDEILDFFNYKFIEDPSRYMREKKDLFFQGRE